MLRPLHFFQHHKKLSTAVLVVVIVALFILWPRQPKSLLTDTAVVGDVIKTVSVTGIINAEKTVNLTFQIGGTLVYLPIAEGDVVKANQVIAALDQRTAQKNLEAALTNYSEQRNTFDQTQANNQNATPVSALNDTMKRILENNQYDLNKSIISVELQDLAKQESVLTTPIAGIVTRADAKTTGINITPVTTFTVTDPNSLDFKMEVDESDIGQVSPGQKVSVSLDSFPNETLNLTVNKIDFVSHTTSSGGNAYYVYANLSANPHYRVGMNGNADITVNSKLHVLTISASSVVDNSYVYLKTGNGYKKQPVTLGLQNDTMAEVISGLSAGDVVAIDPTSVPQNMIIK